MVEMLGRARARCANLDVMLAFDAVLFDWSGTLVHDPHPRDRIRRALAALGREHGASLVDDICENLDEARLAPDVAARLRAEDTSAPRHRAANLAWFDRAGLDPELAGALYDFDDEIDNRPLYADAIETLSGLRRLGVKVAVVSDIHLDLRKLLTAQGVGDLIDAYVLSFEHGCQKPDPRMFLTALELLEVEVGRTLMVGDRASHDGGGAALGITTLILPPPPPAVGPRGLDIVIRMVHGREPG